MFRFSARRKIATLVLTLVFAAPWCAAAAPRPGFEPGNTASRVPTPPLEQFRTGFWIWLRGTWTKAGCTIDPGGKPACGPTSTTSPAPTSTADAGCGIDPGGSPCGGHQ